MPKILSNKELLRKLEPYIVPAVVVLVGLSAFGLGRLSAVGEERQGLVVRLPDGSQVAASALVDGKAAAPTPSASSAAGSGTYVASKSGSKYYLTSCSGVSRIKEENKVWFASAADAAAAGYEPAANCSGL